MKRLPLLLIVITSIVAFIVSEMVTVKPSRARGDAVKVVSFWAFSTPAQTMNLLKREFEFLHPDIRVEVQTVPWESLQPKTLWAIAANSNVPDVVVGSSEWTGGLANSGALDPLDNYLGPEFFERYFPATLEVYQYPEIRRDHPGYRGRMRQYGVPLDLDLMLVFYRADVIDPLLEKMGLEQFPSTWEQLQDLGQAVKAQTYEGRRSTYLLYLDPHDPVPLSMAFLPSSGASFLSRNLSQASFANQEGLAAFEFFSRLLRTGSAIRWQQSTMEDPVVLFKTGRALANISGPWYAKMLQMKIPEQAGKWRVALFPSRAPGLPRSGLGGACLAMPHNARNKEQAIELIKFMATDKFALAYFNQVGTPPPQHTAWKAPVFDSHIAYFGGQQIYHVVRQAIEKARPLQLLPSSEITKGPVRWALRQITTYDTDLTATLRKAAMDADRILATQ